MGDRDEGDHLARLRPGDAAVPNCDHQHQPRRGSGERLGHGGDRVIHPDDDSGVDANGNPDTNGKRFLFVVTLRGSSKPLRPRMSMCRKV